jgi:cation:H+ antiporter
MTIKLIVGLVLLIVGAELLVRGASKIALAAGMTPLVVGLTVVAFGTSAPEFAVTLKGVMEGASGVSTGNIVGSNIFNVLFILGISALVAPLVVHKEVVRVQVPIAVAATVIAFGLALDGTLGQIDGIILFALAISYVVYTVKQGRSESAAASAESDDEETKTSALSTLLSVGMLLAGLALLVLGADWLVTGAVSIAKQVGVSDFLIGVTIVAAGTSLPEVATSIMAALRGERDIAVGNVVGSNIFNILVVLGGSSALAADGIAVSTSVLKADFPIMLAVVCVLFPIVYTEHTISRWEAGLLLAGYGGYVTLLLM